MQNFSILRILHQYCEWIVSKQSNVIWCKNFRGGSAEINTIISRISFCCFHDAWMHIKKMTQIMQHFMYYS